MEQLLQHLREAMSRKSKVNVVFLGTINQHEYRGHVKTIGDGDDPLISFWDGETVGATIDLHSIRSLTTILDEKDSQTVTDLKDACSGGYRVKIDFIGCARTGVVTSVGTRAFRLLESGVGKGDSHTFQAVLSVERITQDVAKERWKWEFQASRNKQCLCSDKRVLVELADASTSDMSTMKHAPDLLEMLEKVAKGAAVRDLVSEYVTTIPSGMLLDINEVIKQARGGE